VEDLTCGANLEYRASGANRRDSTHGKRCGTTLNIGPAARKRWRNRLQLLAPGVQRLLAGGLLAPDFPRCVMWDIHCRIAATTSKCRQSVASKRLFTGDARVFAGATCDDVRTAFHVWLRLVEVSGIEGREYLVAVSVC
jgi:hypothetical protein